MTPPPSGWTVVVDDQFNSGGVPAHWSLYDGPYSSSSACAAPSQDVVSGGYLNLDMSYQTSGSCGAAWYTGGMALSGFSSVDQRVTVRFRIVDTPVVPGNSLSHFIVPMRWPDIDSSWPAGGEEDYCESDQWPGCTATLIGPSGPSGQIQQQLAVDLTQWHTVQTTRLDNTVTISIDGTVVWYYVGDSTTLPDTLKHVVLQQECHHPCQPTGATTSNTEDIQIDWITVENPS